MESREIHVAPDRFEVTSGEALLITELQSAIAVCVYDAAEEAGALLHLRCIVRTSKPADVTDTTLASLGLEVGRSFGYWFDFGDDWWHQINVEAIEDKVPRGKFPKVTKREGKSPPQYAAEDK